MVTQPKSALGSSAVPTWVLLSYRIPREPSTPRIAVWRKLKDLGVAQLGDGLVALPLNDRTREQLDWVAAQILDADGTAIVWEATTARRKDGAAIGEQLKKGRTEEYEAIVAEVAASASTDKRTIARWRREWRRIDRRDHLRSSGREAARLAIADAAIEAGAAPVVEANDAPIEGSRS